VKRQARNLSQPLEHQLKTYALAASAAGVGLMALAKPAAAKIVYTPTHRVIPPNTNYYLGFTHEGGDVLLSNVLKSSMISNILIVHASVVARGLGTYGGAAGNSAGFAFALPAGHKVGTSGQFFESFPGLVASTCEAGNVKHQGPWQNVERRYLGVRFSIDGKIHYGWARFNVSDSACNITATLTGYAYETIVNKPIITGKTKGPDLTSLTTGSLGQLAQGASGLSASRQKEAVTH
jgi:hypothetical protein